MSTTVDERIQRLRTELEDHTRIADHLGLDLERPLRSLDDGYPENTVALIGKLTEKLLKELWQHHGIAGDPSTRALNDLVKGCRPYIRSRTVTDALDDIRRLRNRSTHDGYEISEEDGLLAVRRLVDVLIWFTDTGSSALVGRSEPHMASEVARRCEFLAGLHVTLGFRQAKRFVLTPDTVYLLFCREAGMRLEYVELLVSRDGNDLRAVLASEGGELLRTHLPKTTRFVVLDGESAREAETGSLHHLLGLDYRIVPYEQFIDTVVDLGAHLPDTAAPAAGAERPVAAGVLSTDEKTGEARICEAEDASALLRRLAAGAANVLVTGRPGSGKSTLLRSVVNDADTRRFRFYFDLGLKGEDESFADYVGRVLAPCMVTDRTRSYDLFLYLIRSGAALCVLDAIDEGVDEPSPAGFLRLFADLAPVLSAESAVVMSSRVSFLADSPQVRQLLDHRAARSEQLVEQLYANGVDPARVPHFHLLRLAEPEATFLEKQLASELQLLEAHTFEQLLGQHISRTLAAREQAELEERLPEAFGHAFLAGRTVFGLLDVHRALGATAFVDGRLEWSFCVLAPLLRHVGPDQAAFVHTAYQELLAARFLSTQAGRRRAAAFESPAFITEQVRAFLAATDGSTTSEDGILPSGTYVVGPAERLLLRSVPHPVRFDRHAVTIARYRRFLEALNLDGTSAWDHPEQPNHIAHTPWMDRLRDPDYYSDPRYDQYPATCVTWWSAYAFAAFEGKRLPTSLEWEAAARGSDGRLFPWGDQAPDTAVVNCADTWVGQPVVTFQAWQRDFAQAALRQARTTAVNQRSANRSPYGVVDMVGNVWEFTSTAPNDADDAVICGGSYDNPLRAVQASSKGIFRKHGASNVVGFRCVQDLPDGPQEAV